MVGLFRDLIAHKGHANAALLGAIRQHPAAPSDPEIRELLHHILLANRFWLLVILGRPFDLEAESRPAGSFDALVQRYARTQAQENAWLEAVSAADLERIVKDPLIPNGECSVAQAVMQVCMHSHGHRAQCAKRLQCLGGTPPPTDFILWLPNRPHPEWPEPLEVEPAHVLPNSSRTGQN